MFKMGGDTKNEVLDGQHIETVRRFKDSNDLIGKIPRRTPTLGVAS